jgi:hypothetical protein
MRTITIAANAELFDATLDDATEPGGESDGH